MEENSVSKAEFEQFRGEVKLGFAEVRAEFKQELADVRSEVPPTKSALLEVHHTQSTLGTKDVVAELRNNLLALLECQKKMIAKFSSIEEVVKGIRSDLQTYKEQWNSHESMADDLVVKNWRQMIELRLAHRDQQKSM